MTIKLDKSQLKEIKSQLKNSSIEPTQKTNKIVYSNPDVSKFDAPKKIKIAKWNLKQGQLDKIREINDDSMYKYYNYTNIDNPTDRSVEIKPNDIMVVLEANFFDSDESKMFIKLGSVELIRQYSGNQMNNYSLCYFQGCRILVCTDILSTF